MVGQGCGTVTGFLLGYPATEGVSIKEQPKCPAFQELDGKALKAGLLQ